MTEHKGLVAALIAAQSEFGKALKDSVNPHFKSRYVDLQGVYDACRDALASHGLVAIQTTETRDAGPVLITELAHVSGQSRTSIYPLQPAKQNDPQSLGACLTYARRYSLMAIVGLAPEDDDGNEASGRESPKEPAARLPAQSAKPSAPVAAKPTSAKITPQHVQQLQIEARKREWAGSTAEEKRDSRLAIWADAIGRKVTTATELLDSEFETVMRETCAQPAILAVAK